MIYVGVKRFATTLIVRKLMIKADVDTIYLAYSICMGGFSLISNRLKKLMLFYA